MPPPTGLVRDDVNNQDDAREDHSGDSQKLADLRCEMRKTTQDDSKSKENRQ
jgi:hypothetical protein